MSLDRTIAHYSNNVAAGACHSVTYKFHSSQGVKMYVIVNVDEFNVINGMFLNIGESGTTLHNVVNALGRMVSLAIQEVRKTNPGRLTEYLMKTVGNLSGMSSDSVWMSDELGSANSIPDVLGLILLRHVEIEETMDDMHTGEEE